MPSFDVSCEVDWQEIDNAKNHTLKEVRNRFDFKGIKTEIELDAKNKLIHLTCSQAEKIDVLMDAFQSKLVKRGVSLLAIDFQETESASGGSARKKAIVKSGISKEDGKKIIKLIKEQKKLKAQAQIQDEQVRVTGKKRDELQTIITFLKSKMNDLKLPLTFGNFRD